MFSEMIRRTGLRVALVVCACGTASSALASDLQTTARQAQQLIDEGRVIEARALLIDAQRGAERDEITRIMQLLRIANDHMRMMGQVEINLQRARLNLRRGDLVQAEMYATHAIRNDEALKSEQDRASAILDEAARLRFELQPTIEPALEQAMRDFDAERFAEAKAGFESVNRIGGELTNQQRRTLRRYRERIRQLELRQGAPFEVEYTPMGVLGGQAARTGAGAVTAASLGQQDNGFDEGLRAEAEDLRAEADAAFDAGEYARAANLYRQLLTEYRAVLSEQEVLDIGEREGRALNRTGFAPVGVGGADGPLEETIQARQLERDIARTETLNLIQQAEEALAAGDVTAAENAIASARARWVQVREFFSEDAYASQLEAIQLLRDQIQQREEELSQEARLEASERIREQAEEAEREAERQRAQEIADALDRARALQMEQKYEQALEVVEQVLFRDPNNAAARLVKDVLTDTIIYRRWRQLQQERSLSYAEESIEIQRGLVAPQGVIDYPPDWPEISRNRGQIRSFTESEVDRRVLAQLETGRIPASFNDVPIEDVLTYIASVTGQNVDVDWDSLEQVSVTRDTRVSLDLRDVSPRTVLDRVMEKVSLDDIDKAGWAIQDGVVVVASDRDLRKNTFIVIYDVRDLLFEFRNGVAPQGLDLGSALDQGGGGAGGGGGGAGGGGGGLFGGQGGGGNQDLNFDPDTGDLLEQLVSLIEENVDPENWEPLGEQTGVIREFQGNLIIRNTAANHREVQRLLDKLREVRNVQISVDGRILAVSTDFFEQIGFDLDVYFNAENDAYDDAVQQLTNFGGLITGPSGNTPLLPSQIPVGGGVVGVPGYTINPDGTLNPPAGDGTPNVFAAVPAQSGISQIPGQQDSLGITEGLIGAASDFASGIVAGNPALSVAGTFLDDVQVDFLIEATQADQRNVMLTAPRLTFPNGGTAFIQSATQVAFVSDLTPVVGTSSVAFDPTIGQVQEGFLMQLGGVVSADRRYVNINAIFQLSTIVEIAGATQSFAGAAGGTGGSQGGDIATGTIQLPILQVTQIETGVTVPDKGTILLGGQRMAEEVEVESGVPVLSKIPLINRFFTNTATAKSESTLLILLRPEILIQNEREEQNFPGLQDALEAQFGG